MKIQISSQCKQALDSVGGFATEKRGMVQVNPGVSEYEQNSVLLNDNKFAFGIKKYHISVYTFYVRFTMYYVVE